MKRARFCSRTVLVLTLLWTASSSCYSAETDAVAIKTEITKRHDEAVKRLQGWIGEVAIAAHNPGYAESAEDVAKLGRDGGFQQATVITTDGKPGVFAALDAGAP